MLIQSKPTPYSVGDIFVEYKDFDLHAEPHYYPDGKRVVEYMYMITYVDNRRTSIPYYDFTLLYDPSAEFSNNGEDYDDTGILPYLEHDKTIRQKFLTIMKELSSNKHLSEGEINGRRSYISALFSQFKCRMNPDESFWCHTTYVGNGSEYKEHLLTLLDNHAFNQTGFEVLQELLPLLNNPYQFEVIPSNPTFL